MVNLTLQDTYVWTDEFLLWEVFILFQNYVKGTRKDCSELFAVLSKVFKVIKLFYFIQGSKYLWKLQISYKEMEILMEKIMLLELEQVVMSYRHFPDKEMHLLLTFFVTFKNLSKC